MSWHHLWFLAYVLVLTFVLLPLLPVGAQRARPRRSRQGSALSWRAPACSG